MEAPGPIDAPATTSVGREPSSQIQAAGAEATTKHRATTSIASRAPERRLAGRLGIPFGAVIADEADQLAVVARAALLSGREKLRGGGGHGRRGSGL